MLIGLGFTFFSGAVEAWLVDALGATGYTGDMEAVFGRGQIVSGAAMLVGSVAGGIIAQESNLGVPYVLRGVVLVAMFLVAFRLMRDLGFTPRRGRSPTAEVPPGPARRPSEYGWRRPPVRWLMLEALFTGGVGIYVFYALQPYLLQLWGDPRAYSVAGLVAAIVAGSQMLGGLAAPRLRRLFHRRTSALLLAAAVSAAHPRARRAPSPSFWAVLAADRRVGAALRRGRADASGLPQRHDPLGSSARRSCPSTRSTARRAGCGPSRCSAGRPTCGATAPPSSSAPGISLLGLPFLALSRREHDPADRQLGTPAAAPAAPAAPPTTSASPPPTLPRRPRRPGASPALDE